MAEEALAEEAAEIIVGRVARALVNGEGRLNGLKGVEVQTALNDLAVRLDRTAELLRHLVRLVKPEAPLADTHLTPRELIVLGQLADGRSNAEIAAACWISENTVKFHLRNIFRKLNIQDRGQAMMISRAMQRNLGLPAD
jgi:DNA-binding CsgD family transcriptional regulator